jgi:CelD/BcsL family acetyltransferase involved in cellulose biosynthesis
MITAEAKRPSTLSEREIEAWRGFCAAEPAWSSPLLGPDFARLVGEVREDARVAVFRRGGGEIGFLPFHKRPDGRAWPIGAAFSDYHALVSAPGERLDGAEALAAAGISGLRMGGLIDPRGAFSDLKASEDEGYLITLNGSPEEHSQALKAINPKRYKNWGRLRNKLEREAGEVTLTPDDRSPEVLEKLIAWKREQFGETGLHDVLRPAWAQALFEAAFARRDGDFRGVMITLHAGDRLAAGFFGVASGGVMHAWLSAIDRKLASCGPGQVLMLMVPEALQALGLKTLDLGPSHAHYKAPFATGVVPLREGLAIAQGRVGQTARSLDGAWALAGEHRIGAVARLRRRLDHIASAETSMGGRVRGVVDALAGAGRRASSRAPAPAAPAMEDA